VDVSEDEEEDIDKGENDSLGAFTPYLFLIASCFCLNSAVATSISSSAACCFSTGVMSLIVFTVFDAVEITALDDLEDEGIAVVASVATEAASLCCFPSFTRSVVDASVSFVCAHASAVGEGDIDRFRVRLDEEDEVELWLVGRVDDKKDVESGKTSVLTCLDEDDDDDTADRFE
jgi:hypothetical protein